MTGTFNTFGGLGDMPTQGEALPTAASKVSKKLINTSLEDLYAQVAVAGKVTPSFRTAIIAKEDFSQIQKTYCSLVCGLCSEARRPLQARLQSQGYDVVVVQDHNALPDRFKSSEQVEQITRDIVGFLATKYFQGLTYTVLNSMKCVPTEKDMRGAAVTITKIKPCSAYLHAELRRIKPKVIISLATNTNKILGLNLSSATSRGEFHNTEFGPTVVTLHPKVLTMIRQNASGKAWGADYLEAIDRDFEKAARIARGDLKIVSLEDALIKASENIFICRSVDQVKASMALLMSFPMDKIVSFDLETTSLDAWAANAKILTAQFGYTDLTTGVIKAIVIPLWHRDNTWFDADEAWPFIAEFLLRPSPKVGHNIKFDIIYTYVTQGVRVANAAFDTLLLLHAINSGLKGNYSLKKAVWDFLPETGLGGYEDKLPKLTKGIDDEESEEVESEVE